jgi:hypothetical protein
MGLQGSHGVTALQGCCGHWRRHCGCAPPIFQVRFGAIDFVQNRVTFQSTHATGAHQRGRRSQVSKPWALDASSVLKDGA